MRRGGRVVECGGLENRFTSVPGNEGSNPSSSARTTNAPHRERFSFSGESRDYPARPLPHSGSRRIMTRTEHLVARPRNTLGTHSARDRRRTQEQLHRRNLEQAGRFRMAHRGPDSGEKEVGPRSAFSFGILAGSPRRLQRGKGFTETAQANSGKASSVSPRAERPSGTRSHSSHIPCRGNHERPRPYDRFPWISPICA